MTRPSSNRNCPASPVAKRRARAVRRPVGVQPAQHELDQRLGALLARAERLLPARQVGERELGRVGRAAEADRLEGRHVDALHRREQVHVVVEHGAPLVVVACRREVGAAPDALHHDAARVGAEAVEARHRDAVRGQHLQHAVLVLEAVDARALGTVAAKVDRDDLAVALDVEVERRAPARLALGAHHAPADHALDLGERALPARLERGAPFRRSGLGWLDGWSAHVADARAVMA